MSCGFKHEGIIFKDRQELVDYVSTGKKPFSNIVMQNVKNSVIKKFLNMSNPKNGMSGIARTFPDFTDADINNINATVGSIDNIGAEYFNYLNGNSKFNNTLKSVFDRIGEYFVSMVNAAEVNNGQEGMERIPVSPQINELYQKIINESSTVREAANRSAESNRGGFFTDEADKWYIPEREVSEGGEITGQGADAGTGETNITQEGNVAQTGQQTGAGNRNQSAQSNSSGSVQDSPSNFQSQRDTIARGGAINGYPERVRIQTGDYVAWSDSLGRWTNIVKPTGNGRYGIVRPANAIEIKQANDMRKSMYYGPDYGVPIEPPTPPSEEVDVEERLNVPFDTFNSVTNFIREGMSDPDSQSVFEEIMDNLGIFFRGGYYFTKKGDKFFFPGKNTPEGRYALLNIKKPLYSGTTDYDQYKLNPSEAGYDAVIDKAKGTIEIVGADTIFEEEIPGYIASQYFKEKSEGSTEGLVPVMENFLRGQIGEAAVEYENQIQEEQVVPSEPVDTRNETLENMIFGYGDPRDNIDKAMKAGFIEMAPNVLFSMFRTQFEGSRISYDDLVDVMGTDMFPVMEDSMRSASGIENYAILPSRVNDPVSLFRTMGLPMGYAEFFRELYDAVPNGYERVRTALKMGFELFYPEKTGLGILNHMPITKEERYFLEEKYGDIDGKLQDIFLYELSLDEGKSFWFTRTMAAIPTILKKAKAKGFKLPAQYEGLYKLFREKNPVFDLGDVLTSPEGRFSVYNVDYSNLDNLQYQLRDLSNNSFVIVDSKAIDAFQKVNQFESESMNDALSKVSSALAQIQTSIEVRNPSDFRSPVTGEKAAEAYYDIFTNTINVSASDTEGMSLFHEAAHAAFLKGIRINKDNIISLHMQISAALANGTEQERNIHNLLNEIMGKYTVADAEGINMAMDELIAHEYMAQVVSILAAFKTDIQPQTQKNIIDRIIKWFRDIIGWNQRLDLNNIDDVISFVNGLAKKLRTGEEINFQQYKEYFNDEAIYQSGTLYNKSVGIGMLKPGKKYPVTDADKKLTFRTVYLTGEVDGNPFVQFEDSPTRYFSHNISVMPIKGFTDKFGIVMSQEAKSYEEPKPAIFDERAKRLVSADLVKRNQEGFIYTEGQVFKKFKEMGILGDMNFSEFLIFSDGVRSSLEPIAPQPKPEQPPVVPPVPEPKPVIPGQQSTLDSLIGRINNFDIDHDSIKRWMDNNEAPEYFTNLSELGDYMSGFSIENYTGEVPKNNQAYIKMQIGVGAQIADKILADLKAIYPGDTYVQKTIELLSSRTNSITGTAFIYAALERDLIGRKKEELDNHRKLTNLQKIVHERSQAHIRNVSKALNARKTAYTMVRGSIKPSDVQNIILPKEYVKSKKDMEDAMESGDINNVADESVVSAPTKQGPAKKKKTNVERWESKVRPMDFINEKLSDLKNLINKIC